MFCHILSTPHTINPTIPLEVSQSDSMHAVRARISLRGIVEMAGVSHGAGERFFAGHGSNMLFNAWPQIKTWTQFFVNRAQELEKRALHDLTKIGTLTEQEKEEAISLRSPEDLDIFSVASAIIYRFFGCGPLLQRFNRIEMDASSLAMMTMLCMLQRPSQPLFQSQILIVVNNCLQKGRASVQLGVLRRRLLEISGGDARKVVGLLKRKLRETFSTIESANFAMVDRARKCVAD